MQDTPEAQMARCLSKCSVYAFITMAVGQAPTLAQSWRRLGGDLKLRGDHHANSISIDYTAITLTGKHWSTILFENLVQAQAEC